MDVWILYFCSCEIVTCSFLSRIQVSFLLGFTDILLVSYPLVAKPVGHLKTLIRYFSYAFYNLTLDLKNIIWYLNFNKILTVECSVNRWWLYRPTVLQKSKQPLLNLLTATHTVTRQSTHCPYCHWHRKSSECIQMCTLVSLACF